MRPRQTSGLVVASVLTATGLALAGCRQAPPPPSSMPAAAAPAAAVQLTPPNLTGSFEAVSTTAMGISGDLKLTARALTFRLGLLYQTETVGAVLASTDYGKSADSWADLLNVPPASVVEVRRVVLETIGSKAPNGGLCSPDPVTYLVLGTAADEGHAPALKVAVFKGPAAPGPEASATDLCGTFNYGPQP